MGITQHGQNEPAEKRHSSHAIDTPRTVRVDAALGIACEITPTIRSGPTGLALPRKAKKFENRLLGPTNKIDARFQQPTDTPIRYF
jgi:hypothetical protein